MRLTYIADIDEGVEGGWGNGLFGAVHEAVDVCSGGVEVIEGVDVVCWGPVDHGWADGGESEVWVVPGDVVPGCFSAKVLEAQ